MKIKVIFDKRALDNSLHIGWGVSFLVDDKILFDTGEKGEWLLRNMEVLGIDVSTIEAVVISHDHWDHTGGLWQLLAQRKKIAVCACPGFSEEFKNKVKTSEAALIEAKQFTELAPAIFVTGEIPGNYHGNYMPEQALVLKTQNGITVITGCAHPGILKIVETVKTHFLGERIYCVFGGFHMMESDRRLIEIIADNFKKAGVLKAGPTHCSGEAAEDIFKRIYAENFVPIQAGQTIEV